MLNFTPLPYPASSSIVIKAVRRFVGSVRPPDGCPE
jgi:hypothetical protein